MAWIDSTLSAREIVPCNRDGELVPCIPAKALGLNIVQHPDQGSLVYLILTCEMGSTAFPLTDAQVEQLTEELPYTLEQAKKVRRGTSQA